VLGGFARVTFSFFAGVALYRLWLRRPTRIRLHPVILFVLLILPLTWRLNEGPFAWLYELAVITLWMPLLVWLGAGSTAKGFWLRVCVVFGALSYPLYVVHAPILSVVGQIDNYQVAAFLSKTAPWGALGLIFLLGAFAWLLATYVDAPVRRWLTGILMPNWSKARARRLKG
jgi:peptidoglycan/LPS O-acetylase OafA/YrhL